MRGYRGVSNSRRLPDRSCLTRVPVLFALVVSWSSDNIGGAGSAHTCILLLIYSRSEVLVIDNAADFLPLGRPAGMGGPVHPLCDTDRRKSEGAAGGQA